LEIHSRGVVKALRSTIHAAAIATLKDEGFITGEFMLIINSYHEKK